MKHFRTRLSAMLTAICLSASFAISLAASDEPRADAVVTLKPGVDPHKAAELLESALPSAKLHAVYDTLLSGFALNVPESSLELLERLDFVESARICSTFEPLAPESASRASAAFDAANVAAERIGLGSDIDLDGDGVIVAVIDSGFDIDHAAFDGRGITEAITLDEIAELLNGEKLTPSRVGIEAEQVYVSAKLPFVFDYSDYNADVYSPLSHGTHVAGIVGARETYKGSMHGIAPGAQLLLMKVFADSGAASPDFAVINALEDAVKLGADVINLSLGLYSGSSSNDQVSGLGRVIANAEKLGVTVVCAAGNDSVSTKRSNLAERELTELPSAAYTDYGTLSYPASLSGAIAVGSVDSGYVYGDYFKLGDERIGFNDTNSASGVLNKSFGEHFDGKALPYVLVPGIGSREDYRGIIVKNKIALVRRGTLTFVEKANIAADMGALAVIVYDNEPDSTISMELTGARIPAVSISLEDGERLLAAESRRVSFGADFTHFEEAENPTVSHFSSVGCTPSLELKPELCAIGGNVWSTVGSDGDGASVYGAMSGSSMASPQVAGICALLCELLADESIPSAERSDAIKRLLMNTATPLLQEDGVEISPRTQGAGLVDPLAALDCELALTSTATGDAKIELFDQLGERIFLAATLENLTDSPLSLSLGVTLTGDGCEEIEILGEKYWFSSLTAVPDRASEIRVGEQTTLNYYSDGYSPLELTLASGEKRDLRLEIELDKENCERLDAIFENGRFIEGYIICESEKNRYVMPYMGYHGDWSSAPIIDPAVYSDELTIFGGSALMLTVGGELSFAGATDTRTLSELISAGEGAPRLDTSRLAFSPNGDTIADRVYFHTELLRNSRAGMLVVRDASGDEVCRVDGSSNYYTKSGGSEGLKRLTLAWDGSDGQYSRYILPDGDYTLEYSLTLDYLDGITQSFTFPMKLDTKKPSLESVEYTDGKLKITASDASSIVGLRVYDGDSGRLELRAIPELCEDGLYYAELECELPERFFIDLTDSARNTAAERVTLAEITAAA